MDDRATAELEALRARAYGPGADIQRDPGALQRLEELEQQRRASDEAAPGDVAASGANPEVEPIESAATSPDSADAAAGEDEASDPPRAHGRSRWMPWAWAASLIAVAVVASLWTFTNTLVMLAPFPRDVDARQVDVLQTDASAPMPSFFSNPGVTPVGYEEFLGLTPIVTSGGWFGGESTDLCITVMRTEDIDPTSDSLNGPLFSGCSAGSFPAVLTVPVTDQFPEELRERFPEGTGLQFVLDGERIGVFTDAE
jgi:hypothetical protein